MDALDLDFDDALKRLPVPAFVTRMVLRTRFFDDLLEDSVRDGARQVVILRAGFDSRAYRFQDHLRSIRFFEVDYRPTQEYKKLRVQKILGKLPRHVRYVRVDFTKDDLLVQLKNERLLGKK